MSRLEELAKKMGKEAANQDLLWEKRALYVVNGLGVTARDWAARLNEFGVKLAVREDDKVLMVTHRGIEREDIEYTLKVAERVSKQIKNKSRLTDAALISSTEKKDPQFYT